MQTPEHPAAAGQPAFERRAKRLISTFAAEWCANLAGHPCIPCDAWQLHRAWQRWCATNGARDVAGLCYADFLEGLRISPPVVVTQLDAPAPVDEQLSIVMPAHYIGHPLSIAACLEVFAAHLRGYTERGLEVLQARQGTLAEAVLPICPTCHGAGSRRAPYARDFTACPDCLTRPISTASSTTAALVKLSGSSD